MDNERHHKIRRDAERSITTLKESLKNNKPLTETETEDIIENFQSLSDDHHRFFEAIKDIKVKIWYHIGSSDETAKRRKK